jgi:hypothetical protein
MSLRICPDEVCGIVEITPLTGAFGPVAVEACDGLFFGHGSYLFAGETAHVLSPYCAEVLLLSVGSN